jgi:hypothetical protein
MPEERHLLLTQCTPLQPLTNWEIMDVLKQDSSTAAPNQWRDPATGKHDQPSTPTMLAVEPAFPFPMPRSAQLGQRPPGLAGLFGAYCDFGFHVGAWIADRRRGVTRQVETEGLQDATTFLITGFPICTASA